MMWTFYQIEVFIHHACSGARFDRADAAGYADCLNSLVEAGLLEYVDGIPRATDKGYVWGDMLKSTPLPVQRFIDPRFDKLEE